MRSSLLILISSLCLASAVAQSPAEIAQGYMDGELILEFRQGIAETEQREWISEQGYRVRYHYPLIKAWFLSYEEGDDARARCASLRLRPEISWAHPNWLGERRQSFPNDPLFGSSYALHNTGQNVGGSNGTADADMDCPEAWDLTTDASGVVLAIVDSGTRTTHQDLAPNIWSNPAEIPGNGVDDDGNGFIDDIVGWDFLGNDNSPDDLDGHGTNVSGCAFAVGDNGIGMSGVCWQASAMVLKDGDTNPQVALSAAAIEYAAMNGATVANFSTGYGNTGQANLMQNAVNVAQGFGMIICVAAGNSSTNLNTTTDVPATFTNDNLLVVAASNNDDNPTGFTSFGATHVDVAAAGDDVRTTTRNSDTSYGFASGTSFSAPLTTGCVALAQAYNPQASYQTVRSAFINNCDQIASWNGLVASGGRINLFDTLNALGPGSGAGPSPSTMSFAQALSSSAPDSLTMVATTATAGGDPVEYLFEFDSSAGAGGSSSSWQSSSSYTDTGLDPNTSYRYRVRARNAVTLVETNPSVDSPGVTLAAVPGLVTISGGSDTGFTSIVSIDLNGNPGSTSLAIEVDGMWLSFSGQLQATPFWVPSTVWTFAAGPTLPLGVHSISVKARNSDLIETSLGPVTTFGAALAPCAAGEVPAPGGGRENVLTISGSAGDAGRRVQIGLNQPFSIDIANPSLNPQPAAFILLARIGLPSPSEEIALPGIGTLCFTPCDVNPAFGGVNVASSIGPTPCGELLPATPAPWSFASPGLPFPIVNFVMQGFIEFLPGQIRTTNGLVLTIQ